MKTRFKINMMTLTLICSFFLFTCAGDNPPVTDSTWLAATDIKVWGNCEMCQETIERSLKIKGISAASWNVETKILSVKYDSTLVTIDDIQKKVAASGYDTEKYRASEESYEALHECCQYERKQ